MQSYANPLLVLPDRPLPRSVAVIGAGTIGPDIAYYLKAAVPGLKLCIVDVVQEAVDRAVRRLHDHARKAVATGRMSQAQASRISENVVGTLDYGAIADAEWVLEAATENLHIKQTIFERVEAIVSPRALITSNTSSLPAEQMFDALRHGERATITHFFTPAWKNPVVEVVRWRGVDSSVVEYLRWLFCFTGKVPLETADVAGFMLDRVFTNWCNESALMLDRATAPEIDRVSHEFVHAGPFSVLNLTRGNPIMIAANTLQARLEGEHYLPASIFGSVDRWVDAVPGGSGPLSADAAEAVRERLLGILFSQSMDIVDRRIGEPADLELGCRLALGFKKGPFEVMNGLGEEMTRRLLDRLSEERPGMPTQKRPFAAYQDFLRHVLVDEVDRIKVITLRRPEALNALHDDMTDEILSVIRRYESDADVKGFVIVGYGRAFCAGADIGRFPNVLGDPEACIRYAHDCSRLLRHLDGMAKPVVAALNGMCLGGGFELAMRCHAIVAVDSAWMQLPEITLGIVPGIGALVVPYRRWPKAAAIFDDLLRRAERLTAKHAHELGVIDAIADDYAGLLALALERVDTISGHVKKIAEGPVSIPALTPVEPKAANGDRLSSEVIGIMEKAVRDAAAASTFADALEVGYRAFARSACTAAAKEGVAAFQERRRPDFTNTP
ncbi:MAG: enoyl-CoA hydratase/isomerase family protein [Burkholderiales bacterium]|nr:enoyl-CoA hydratase/isomerase family protein [Burkholderiales bacterium]OJX08421.1 MAG: 3-hydroxyacyl-CoA dehydrogenase [Burkholderiales bacterium 70-64]